MQRHAGPPMALGDSSVDLLLANPAPRWAGGMPGLAIWRRGKAIRTGVTDAPLESGDVLLMQGPRSNVELLRTNSNFLILEPVYERKQRNDRAPYAAFILVAVLALAILRLLPISMAMVMGAGLMILTGCLSLDEAYRSIDWRVIFLVVGMLPAGIAMGESGAAQVLGDQMMRLSHGQTIVTLMGLSTISTLLSQILNPAATIVLMAPIALSTAQGIGVDPRVFLLGSRIACSMAFLTPISHQVNMLVMGPGAYHFTDYVRVGLPLSFLVLGAIGAVLVLGCQ